MIWYVSDAASLEDTFSKVNDGDTILLAPGDYDGFVLRQRDFSTGVEIASMDADDPAVITDGFAIYEVKNLRVSDVMVVADEVAPQSGAALVYVSSSSDIVVENLVIQGHIPDETEGRPPNSPASGASPMIDGYGFGTGLSVRKSSNVVIDMFEISDVEYGVYLKEAENVTLSRGHYHDIRTDGVRFTDVRDLVIEKSLFNTFRPHQSLGNPAGRDHADFIQWWAAGASFGVDGLIIRDNVMLQDNGGDQQGIFGDLSLRPDAPAGVGVRDIAIHDNFIMNSHLHGIHISGASDVAIHNNTLLPALPDPSIPHTTTGVPNIQIGPTQGVQPRDTAVYDNVYVQASDGGLDRFGLSPEQAAAQNIVFSSNTALSALEDAYGGLSRGFVTSSADLTPSDPAAIASGDGARGPDPWVAATLDAARLRPPAQRLGDDGADWLFGGGQNVALLGADGDDFLFGGAGDDTLQPGTGDDWLTGGDGADIFSFDADAARGADAIVDLDFGEGDLLILLGGFRTGFFNSATVGDNAVATYANGAQAVISSDAMFQRLIDLPAVSVTVEDETALRLGFNADFNGSEEWTLTVRGPSAEAIAAQMTPVTLAPLAVAVAQAPSPDATPAIPAIPAAPDGVAALYGDDGADVLSGYGGAQWVMGAGGDDRMRGGDGDDVLHGQTGDDNLRGDGGDDVLLGGDGDDFLRGGWGSDTMVGGAGTDQFSFRGGDLLQGDHDVIVDFGAGERVRFEGGFGAGYFDNAAHAAGGLGSYRAGDAATLLDAAGVVDLAAQRDIAASEGADGVVVLSFDLTGDGVADWTLEFISLAYADFFPG